MNFRFCVCFEQGVPWHSGNYGVWIHSETRTWHDKNIQFNKETTEQCVKFCHSWTIKASKQPKSVRCLYCQLWTDFSNCSGVFVVQFEQAKHCSGVFVVQFEQVKHCSGVFVVQFEQAKHCSGVLVVLFELIKHRSGFFVVQFEQVKHCSGVFVVQFEQVKHCFGVFVVQFEQVKHCSGFFVVQFEQVNTVWEPNLCHYAFGYTVEKSGISACDGLMKLSQNRFLGIFHRKSCLPKVLSQGFIHCFISNPKNFIKILY